MEDTNKSFDDWYAEESPFKGNENNEDCKWASKFMQQAYEAGQQSRQVEIELLEKEIIETQEFLNNQNCIKQAEVNELQKRIDDALEKCHTGIRKQGGDYYLELIEGILKGATK